MQQIQKLTEQEMYEVYRQWFPEAFPKDEIRPWRSIRRQCLLPPGGRPGNLGQSAA